MPKFRIIARYRARRAARRARWDEQCARVDVEVGSFLDSADGAR